MNGCILKGIDGLLGEKADKGDKGDAGINVRMVYNKVILML